MAKLTKEQKATQKHERDKRRLENQERKHKMELEKREQALKEKERKDKLRAERNAKAEAERKRKAELRAYHNKNKELLRDYVDNLNVSQKVDKYLYKHSLNEDPYRVARLTQKFRDQEYRRIMRKYSHYFK